MEQQTESTAAQTAQQEQKVPCKSMKRLRFETGLAVLFAAMGAMIGLVLLDVALQSVSTEGTLISNAFEAFKLIAVTVLGYTFGANQAKTGTGE